MSYNSQPPLQPQLNNFSTNYGKDGTGALDWLNQNYAEKENGITRVVKISYRKSTNQSVISIKENNVEVKNEIKEGLILLQLNSNEGNLEYSY